jgi:hypothetical protein
MRSIALENKRSKWTRRGYSYTVDAIPEDDETQEYLNRTMRKPGEPGYVPPTKPPDHLPGASEE